MKRIIFAGAGLAALLTAGVATAAPAFAANGPQQFVTHSNGHADTTSLVNPVPPSQQVVIDTPYGPVWAFDNATIKLTPVPVTGYSDGANYRVDIEYVGSFHGFADPNTGAALDSNGSVKGTISYDVLAAPGQAPDGAGLPSQEPGGINGPGLREMVTQLFDGNATVVGGGDAYSFSYQNGNYVQDNVAPYEHGAVKGH